MHISLLLSLTLISSPLAPGAIPSLVSNIAFATGGGLKIGGGKGLGGLGKMGSMVQVVDPRVITLEKDTVQAINKWRKAKKLPALRVDPRAQKSARSWAQKTAEGKITAAAIESGIKKIGLAPYGYFFQITWAKNSKSLAKKLKKDGSTLPAALNEFHRVAVGSFYADAEDPFYQTVVIFIRDKDPMAGKKGLERNQTDPVMAKANAKLKSCYDNALKENPNYGGEILFEITIGGSGAVSSTRVLHSFDAPSFDTCALNIIRTLRFPKPYKGKAVTLRHPYQFTPPHGDKKIGILSPFQIRTPFRKAESILRKCYDDRLTKNPKFSASMLVEMTITKEGKVKTINLKMMGKENKIFKKCILSTLQKFRFSRPKFGGEATISYPLNFSK